MRSLTICAFAICGALSSAGQTSQEPNTFFKDFIGLEEDQIADIQHGKPGTKVISSKTPSEIAVFGAIYINASPEDYLKAAKNLDALRKSPNYRMNHMVIYRGGGSSGALDSVAIKQLYASHYFQTALDLSVCAKDSSRPGDKGFYLITIKGSRQAGLTGAKGAIVRKNAVSKIRSSLGASLTRIKSVLENKP